jgi:hypothetical protein
VTCICGIDPGIAGGIAFRQVLRGRAVMWSDDLPTTQPHGVGKAWLDATALGAMITNFNPDVAVIERVSSRPGQGLSSTFRFGMAFGICVGVVSALQVPVHYVTPGKWKIDVGLEAPPSYLTKGQAASFRKSVALDLARELYPASAADWARKKDHNRAEAALLAHWGERNGVGSLQDVRRRGSHTPARKKGPPYRLAPR